MSASGIRRRGRSDGMGRLLDGLLAVILAPRCIVCSDVLDRPTLGPVCPACWNSILPLTPPLCDLCGDPLPTWRVVSVPRARCPRCRRVARPIDRSRAIGLYDGALRSIVHALKYDGRRSLAKPLGAMMRARCAEVLSDADLAVPVPLHPSRRRERGFNQAEDLARHIGLPIAAALRRVRRTPPQADLPAGKRHGNVKGAFAPDKDFRRVQGQIVVLIDDVSTTGATLDACARVLKENGAREVRALTAARVVTRRR
jgi:ComF family protein